MESVMGDEIRDFGGANSAERRSLRAKVVCIAAAIALLVAGAALGWGIRSLAVRRVHWPPRGYKVGPYEVSVAASRWRGPGGIRAVIMEARNLSDKGFRPYLSAMFFWYPDQKIPGACVFVQRGPDVFAWENIGLVGHMVFKQINGEKYYRIGGRWVDGKIAKGKDPFFLRKLSFGGNVYRYDLKSGRWVLAYNSGAKR